MDDKKAKRFEPVFPKSGGLIHLYDVREKLHDRLIKNQKKFDIDFHQIVVDHINKILQLLEDYEEVKLTHMSKLAFAHMKNDCAG